jgi:hypothetical protein
MRAALKRRLAGFLQWHAVEPLLNHSRELIFQAIVQRDLARLQVVDDFYPLGGAASYALLYLLIRLLRENEIGTIIELGSGESTRLIDRAKQPGTRHVCYEDDPDWHARTQPRLASCDYRLRSLRDFQLEGTAYRWYDGVDLEPFDVLLVDGPIGSPSWSRIGCWNLIQANAAKDYVVIIDDSMRPGEQATLEFLVDRLQQRGDAPVLHRIESGHVPAMICAGRFAHARFYA